MRGSRAALALLAGAMLQTTEPEARSEPTAWAMAARPELRRQQQVVRTVERTLDEIDRSGPSTPLGAAARSAQLQDAREQLKAVGAGRTLRPSVRLLFARVLYALYEVDGVDDHLRQAAGHLRYVAATAEPVAVRSEAYSDLAMCAARLGQHEQEVAAYARALAIEPHAEARAVLLANQAEGLLAAGEVSRAVAGYRRSLAITPSTALHRLGVTTLWGLGVALDRAGDLEEALREIALARSYDPDDARLHSDSWVFLPDYDRHWYEALGHWLAARQAKDAEERIRAYEQAVLSWSAYLRRAPPSDRWLALAERRHSQCEDALRRARLQSRR